MMIMNQKEHNLQKQQVREISPNPYCLFAWFVTTWDWSMWYGGWQRHNLRSTRVRVIWESVSLLGSWRGRLRWRHGCQPASWAPLLGFPLGWGLGNADAWNFDLTCADLYQVRRNCQPVWQLCVYQPSCEKRDVTFRGALCEYADRPETQCHNGWDIRIAYRTYCTWCKWPTCCNVQGVPKKVTLRICWHHGATGQSPVATTILDRTWSWRSLCLEIVFRCASISWFQVVSEWVSELLKFFFYCL